MYYFSVSISSSLPHFFFSQSHLHFSTLLHLYFIGKLTRHHFIISGADAWTKIASYEKRKKEQERRSGRKKQKEKGKKEGCRKTILSNLFSHFLRFLVTQFFVFSFLPICFSLSYIIRTRIKLQGVRTKWNGLRKFPLRIPFNIYVRGRRKKEKESEEEEEEKIRRRGRRKKNCNLVLKLRDDTLVEESLDEWERKNSREIEWERTREKQKFCYRT